MRGTSAAAERREIDAGEIGGGGDERVLGNIRGGVLVVVEALGGSVASGQRGALDRVVVAQDRPEKRGCLGGVVCRAAHVRVPHKVNQ